MKPVQRYVLTALMAVLPAVSAMSAMAGYVVPGRPGGFDVLVVEALHIPDFQPLRIAVQEAHPDPFVQYSDRQAFQDARRDATAQAGVLDGEDRVLMFMNGPVVTPPVKDVLHMYFPDLRAKDFREFDRGVSLAAVQYGEADMTVTLGLMRNYQVSTGVVLIDIEGRAELRMPAGSEMLSEREIAQGAMTSFNRIIQVPVTVDVILADIEEQLTEAGMRVQVINVADRRSISILEPKFRLAIAFETLTEGETIVLVNVTKMQ
mgnify:FL=1